MDGYQYNPVGALDTGAELVGVTKALEQLLQELETSVQRFIQVNEGETPAAYIDAQRQWDHGHEEMTRNMGGAVRALDDIHREITYADAKGTGYF